MRHTAHHYVYVSEIWMELRQQKKAVLKNSRKKLTKFENYLVQIVASARLLFKTRFAMRKNCHTCHIMISKIRGR